MRLRSPIGLRRLLEGCAGLIQSDLSDDPPITDLAAPHHAGKGSLAFVGDRCSLKELGSLEAAAVLATRPRPEALPSSSIPWLHTEHLQRAMDLLLRACENAWLDAPPFPQSHNRVHPFAVVEGSLEGDVEVAAFCYVGPLCKVGKGSRLEPGAVLTGRTHLGAGCRVQSGAVIGSDGFGFYRWQGRSHPLPHPAGVVVGPDSWIGACTVVAAGILHPTSLGAGTRLDAHVHIGHNVELGEGATMAALSGIAGSTRAGRNLLMGGQAGVADHLELGDDVTVAARGGVTRGFRGPVVLAGFPAREHSLWRREEAAGREAAGKPDSGER